MDITPLLQDAQKRLQEQQVPTRMQNSQGWCQSTVIGILSHPRYKGEAQYNRTQLTDAHCPHGARGLKDLRPGNGRGRKVRGRPRSGLP